jgi:hypothetical protein
MALKIDIKSLIIGLLIGLFTLLAFGATSVRNKGTYQEGTYQLSMAAVGDPQAGNIKYVIYGRIHTGTGKIETWKYNINSNKTVPYIGTDTQILLGPTTNSPGN